MLDIRLLREQPDLVKARLATRGSSRLDDIVDAVLSCDSKRRAVETSLQALQAERNRLSREIGMLRSGGKDTAALEAQVSSQATKMQELSKQAAATRRSNGRCELILPNLPREDVPEGADSSSQSGRAHLGRKTQLRQEQKIIAPSEAD